MNERHNCLQQVSGRKQASVPEGTRLPGEGCLFSYYTLLRVLYVFWIEGLCQICALQIFSVPCLFILLTVSFEELKFLILTKSTLSFGSSMACAFGVIYKFFCLSQSHNDFLLCFPLEVSQF